MDLDMRARVYALELLTTQLISEYLRAVPVELSRAGLHLTISLAALAAGLAAELTRDIFAICLTRLKPARKLHSARSSPSHAIAQPEPATMVSRRLRTKSISSSSSLVRKATGTPWSSSQTNSRLSLTTSY